MDWQAIKESICAARQFRPVAGGFRVLADTMMPSGAVIEVFMQARGDTVDLHDDGAAFDELARNGLMLKSTASLRRLLAETNFKLSADGAVVRERVPVEDVAVGIAILADASLRSAQFMLRHAKLRTGLPLEVRVKDALRTRFPNGRPNWTFEGKRRQQRFDFGLENEAQVILVEAVTPDPASINSAIVKSLDAREAPHGRARPILVYDAEDGWSASALELLGMGGERISLERAASGDLLRAA